MRTRSKAEDENDVSKYRRQLAGYRSKTKRCCPAQRDLAFDALVSAKDWDGRDDWYLTLLSDETLYD